MKELARFFLYGPLILRHSVGRQKLARRAEPEPITEGGAACEYRRAWESSLSVLYAILLEWIYRARTETSGGLAVDLGCGPGHLAMAFSRFLNVAKVIGVDLSEKMLEIAKAEALAANKADEVFFQKADVTDLAFLPAHCSSVTTYAHGAHHLPDLASVAMVLREMQRITRPDGLIVAMDLVRLRTEEVTSTFVKRTGKCLIDQGLKYFYDDFHHSMRAAWTVEEMHDCLPTDTQRYWYQIVPRGLPVTQILIGLPEGRKRIHVREGLPWSAQDNPVPTAFRADWSLLRTLLGAPRALCLRPAMEPLFPSRLELKLD